MLKEQIERKIIITYRWWNNELGIKKEHILALEETANDRITELRTEGYTSGSLSDNIHMVDSDLEKGIEYEGWWELTTENIDK